MKMSTIYGTVLFFLTLSAYADDVKIAYTAEVKGIVCQVCAGYVKTAFEKLPGASGVEIKKTDIADVSTVSFSATSDKLTVEDCERALGEKMKEFPVVKVTAKK